MRLENYNIVLEVLKKDDIELVRYWRNHEKIKGRMQYQTYITEEMQLAWFEKISNDRANYYYFLIHFNGKKVGLINRKKEDGLLEGGMFIWDDEYLESYIPLAAFVIATDFLFSLFNETKTHGRILKNNPKAISFNLSLGFKLCEGQEEVENQLYSLSKLDYYKTSKKIKKYLALLLKSNNKTRLIFENEDFVNGNWDFMNKYFEGNTEINDYFEIIKP